MNEWASALGTTSGRGLSPSFLNALEALASSSEGEWWHDVLAHRDVFIAVRRESINVYHRGASIFQVNFENGKLVPVTHAKYLVRQQQAYARLREDGAFSADAAATLWPRYEGPTTLQEMLRAAAALAGPEKIGLHSLLMNSPHVVDVEIALDGLAGGMAIESIAPGVSSFAEENGERAEIAEAIEAASAVAIAPTRRIDRLDVATVEERNGALALVFHEAKHFANKELRAAANRLPPVLEQMERYEATLRLHEQRLLSEYSAVCRSLVAIDAMRQAISARSGSPTASALSPRTHRVAGGEPLKLDPHPRLVLFGFDEDQKNGTVWAKHRDRLQEVLGPDRIYAVGNTRAKSSAAFR
ncbi:hypothetical protein ABLE91_26745 [Aquabacter sp. CN5-332]|uniref:hypothetical protein n=1 Tax=Aquabacter sp. CN5-332 TaxID=3156608 RepID=UPI0032B34D5A